MPKLYRYTILHDGLDHKVTRHDPGKQWTLKQMQEAVGGGYIEALPSTMYASLSLRSAAVNSRAKIYINEDGKYRSDFQDNLHFDLVHAAGGRTWIDPIKGPAVIEETINA